MRRKISLSTAIWDIVLPANSIFCVGIQHSVVQIISVLLITCRLECYQAFKERTVGRLVTLT